MQKVDLAVWSKKIKNILKILKYIQLNNLTSNKQRKLYIYYTCGMFVM